MLRVTEKNIFVTDRTRQEFPVKKKISNPVKEENDTSLKIIYFYLTE